jgi:steroid delta-isomerase-like uncharacterized protein
MTRDRLTAFFSERQHVWERRDAVALAAEHAADATVVSPIFGTVRGRAAIELTYRDLFTVFADWDFLGEDLVIDDTRVVQVFRARATHAHEFLGMPGTGRRFEIQGALVFHFAADGLIQHERRIYDFSGMLIQIGVLKAKPAAL